MWACRFSITVDGYTHFFFYAKMGNVAFWWCNLLHSPKTKGETSTKPHLLFDLQKACQVICVQVVFVVTVGEHQQVQIPSSRHHLIEGAELVKAQSSLVIIRVGFLEKTKHQQLRNYGTGTHEEPKRE